MIKKTRIIPADLDEEAIRAAMSGLPAKKSSESVTPVQSIGRECPPENKTDKCEETIFRPDGETAGRTEEYASLFLRRKELLERKYAYLSVDHHQTITRIITFLGEGLSISGYLDNVLEEHFKRYEKEINELYIQHSNLKLIRNEKTKG